MNNKLIAFTISNATKNDYEKIKNKIISTTNGWAKIDETLFLVKTNRSSVNLREIIQDINISGKFEKIFVVEWNHPSAWTGLSDEVSSWIKNN